jgi:hypothetical protein
LESGEDPFMVIDIHGAHIEYEFINGECLIHSFSSTDPMAGAEVAKRAVDEARAEGMHTVNIHITEPFDMFDKYIKVGFKLKAIIMERTI